MGSTLFIRLVRGRTGLLLERGEGFFSFPHLCFQEYPAARDIENRCMYKGVETVWSEIIDRLLDAHWHEVILLLSVSLNRYDAAPTFLIERILDHAKSDKFEQLLHRYLYLVTEALADGVEPAHDVHRNIVRELLSIIKTGVPKKPSTLRSSIQGGLVAGEAGAMRLRLF